MKEILLGSLFDGSGGFPLAGSLCGITPVWASEIEPYPIAVTRSRFPNMKHIGSVTVIKGNEVEPVDVITFGSPCQDLSVAGKRAGLKHEDNGDEETTRSGLFMDAIRIIKEMREATNGIYPRIALWENVLGAFSSNKGEDFKVVLEEFIKVVEPTAPVLPSPDKGKWPYEGCYMGEGWSVAWRVLDAQYWGVPQRRRRIYLVADFRGERAGEILFKREGLRGNFAQSGAKRETAAADAERSFVADDREGNCLTPLDVQSKQIYTAEGVAPPLYAGECRWGGGECYVLDKANGICCAVSSKQQSLAISEDCGNTLGANDYKESQVVCYGISSYDSNSMKSSNPHSGVYVAQTSRTLDLNGGNPACNQGGIAIVEPCAFAVENHPADSRVSIDESGKVQTLASRMGTGGGNVSMVLEGKPTIGLSGETDVAPTVVCTDYIVRRLTPTECARLQGFPDKWGHPDKKESLTDEEYAFWLDVRNTHAEINGKSVKEYTREQMLNWYNKLHTDSFEYKMWGNGIALPCALYVMQGIQDALWGGTK